MDDRQKGKREGTKEYCKELILEDRIPTQNTIKEGNREERKKFRESRRRYANYFKVNIRQYRFTTMNNILFFN